MQDLARRRRVIHASFHDNGDMKTLTELRSFKQHSLGKALDRDLPTQQGLGFLIRKTGLTQPVSQAGELVRLRRLAHHRDHRGQQRR